jgi:chorismate synthase
MDDRRDKLQSLTETQCRNYIHERLDNSDQKFISLSEAVLENTNLTRDAVKSLNELKQSVGGLVDIWSVGRKSLLAAKGFGIFMNHLAKWVAPILVAIAAVWAILHGNWPKGD